MSADVRFLPIGVEDESSNILRDYLARLPLELDELLQEGKRHETFVWQLGHARPRLSCPEHCVLEEVRQDV